MQRIHHARERNTTRARSLSGERHTTARSPDIDPSAAVLTTLAPAFVETVPRLDGAPLAYSHELNAELVYELCAALISAGVAKAGDWKKCNEDALTFAKYSVMQAIGIERGELLRRNVEFQLGIGDAYQMDVCMAGSHNSIMAHLQCRSAAPEQERSEWASWLMHWSKRRRG